MSYNEYKCDHDVPIFDHFGLLRTPKKIICTPSLRVRTQSLSSLLNTIDCPSRCPMTCLILTSRLSDLKRIHHWIRDDGHLVKKKKIRLRRAPSSAISLSGGQVSDGRLRRGSIVIAEHPHDMFYTHITSICSGANSVLSQRWWKILYFGTCCLAPPKGSLYPITSGTNPIVVITSEHHRSPF